MPKFKDITGNKYGRWTAIKRVDNKKRQTYWECICECGTVKDVQFGQLTSGQSKSCGCYNKEIASQHSSKKLEGTRFERLVVTSRHGSDKNKQVLWNCQCDCGNTVIVKSSSLINSTTKSCGCLNQEKRKSRLGVWKTGYEEISGELLYRIKAGAIRRNIEYNIEPEYLWNLYIIQNRKCSLTGQDIVFGNKRDNTTTTASLDRINSSMGYIQGNVQWVYSDINIMKNVKDNEEFIKMCELVVEFSRRKNEPTY